MTVKQGCFLGILLNKKYALTDSAIWSLSHTYAVITQAAAAIKGDVCDWKCL